MAEADPGLGLPFCGLLQEWERTDAHISKKIEPIKEGNERKTAFLGIMDWMGNTKYPVKFNHKQSKSNERMFIAIWNVLE